MEFNSIDPSNSATPSRASNSSLANLGRCSPALKLIVCCSSSFPLLSTRVSVAYRSKVSFLIKLGGPAARGATRMTQLAWASRLARVTQHCRNPEDCGETVTSRSPTPCGEQRILCDLCVRSGKPGNACQILTKQWVRGLLRTGRITRLYPGRTRPSPSL